MARPTSTIYRWCTTVANRVAPSAGAKLLGFAAGDPVPSGIHNDLMGFLSDWIAWLGPRPTSLPLSAPNFLPWFSLGVSGSAVSITRDFATSSAKFEFSSGNTGQVGLVLPIEGGKLTAVTVDVDAIDVTTGGSGAATVDVVLRGTDGVDYATYTGSITTTGPASLTVVGTAVATATRDALLYVQIQPGTQSAHYITIGGLTFTFAATP